MAMMEFTGTVQEIGKTQTFPSKTPGKAPFVKRTILVKEDSASNYDNLVEFTATGDKAKGLDAWAPGDEVKIGFFLDGRSWTDVRTNVVRHFTDLKVAKIEVNGFCRRDADAQAQDGRGRAARASAGVPGEIAQVVPGARVTGIQEPQDDQEDLPF